MRRGSAWIPERFWNFETTDEQDKHKISRLEKEGYIKIKLTIQEEKRALQAIGPVCWGDIGDKFNK
jgi:hypothetical protein